MDCMYCGSKLKDGKIEIYEFGHPVITFLHPATIKFTAREDKNDEHKSNTYIPGANGYYCEKCKRIIADFDVEY